MDNLTEQIVNISKASAYDAISQDYGKVKEENVILKAGINKALDELLGIGADDLIAKPGEAIQRICRPLLDAMKQTL